MPISIVSNYKVIEEVVKNCFPEEEVVSESSINGLLLKMNFTQCNIVIFAGDMTLCDDDIVFITSYCGLSGIVVITDDPSSVAYDNIAILEKPFYTKFLAELIENLLRQWRQVFCVLDAVYFLPHKRLLIKPMVGGGALEVDLTQKENELLHYMLIHKKAKKEVLLNEIFGYKDPTSTHTLEAHFYRLRSKISIEEEIFHYVDGHYQIKLYED